MTRFNDATIYDAPAVLMSSILDGEATRRGSLSAVINPTGLTLAERETYATRLKDLAGDSGVGRALLGVASNPWVWATFLFSVPGTTAIGKFGGDVFKLSSRYSPYVRKNGGILQALGVSTPLHVLRGTPTSPALNQAQVAFEHLHAEAIKDLQGPMARALRTLKVPSLDYTNPRLTNDQRERVKTVMLAVQGKLEGWDRTYTRSKMVLDAESQLLVPQKTEVPRLVTANLDRTLRDAAKALGGKETDFTDLADAYQGAMKRRFLRLYSNLDDKTIEAMDTKAVLKHKPVLSEEKVIRIWQGFSNSAFKNAPKASTDELTQQLLHGQFHKYFMANRDNPKALDAYRALIRNTFVTEPNYFPRNIGEYVNEAGEVVGPEILRQQRLRAALSPSASARARVTNIADYHPDDWNDIAAKFGATPELTEKIGAVTKKMTETVGKGHEPLFWRARPTEALDKHMRDTASSYAFFAQTPNAEVLAAAQRAGLKMPTDLNPLGTASIGQVIGADYDAITDDYAKRMITDFLVPAISGKYRPESLISVVAMQNAKYNLKQISDSGLGQTIRSWGPQGADFVNKLEKLADPNVRIEDARGASRWLAKYLYVSHLGLNLGSITLNMTQPWLLGATWLGPVAVGQAYTRSIREMFNYVSDRASQGFAHLDDAEKMEMIRKHFKFADVNGQDMMGISPSFFQDLDTLAFRHAQGTSKSKSGMFFEYMMKGFEKAEWLNRATMAHATEIAFERGGLPTMNNPLFTQTVREMVQETQFGGNLLNTPVMFSSSDPALSKTGPMFASPIMRQFMQFPMRSFAGVFSVSPKLAAGQRQIAGQTIDLSSLPGGGVVPFAIDFMKGMAISSVIHDASRELLGRDLERALYADSAFAIFGGDRFLDGQGNPLPLPPVVDIPINLVRAYLGGDQQLLSFTLPRLVPGGIAAARFFQAAPDLNLPKHIDIQRQFVGWDQGNEHGEVPVFDGQGNLINYQHPLTVVSRAVGFPLNDYPNASKIDHFLTTQRDQIAEYRREAVRAMIAGNLDKANKIKAEFETRFKAPLVIDKAHLKSMMRLTGLPRTDRILERLPSDLRPQYESVVGGSRRTPANAETRRQLIEQRTREALTERLHSEQGPFQTFNPY